MFSLSKIWHWMMCCIASCPFFLNGAASGKELWATSALLIYNMYHARTCMNMYMHFDKRNIVSYKIEQKNLNEYHVNVWLCMRTQLHICVDKCLCQSRRCIRMRHVIHSQLACTQAKLGMRTLVIADVPYVHQLLESYVSTMFSLSYSIGSLEVHGANAIDHLVHCFTHRVYRGTQIAVGRTNGRGFSQSKGEFWTLMAMQQCKAIMHLGSGPEIILVGHIPYNNPSLFTHHTTLTKVPQVVFAPSF